MSIQERILQYLENKDITPYKFCKNLGFPMGYLNKRGAIGTDKYLKIIKYYKDLSPEWLLTGEGTMLINEVKNEMSQVQLPPNESELIALLKEKIKDKEAIIKEKDKNVRLLEEKIKQLEAQLSARSSIPTSVSYTGYTQPPAI